jgi:GWxTD domain-containing protein
MRKILLFSILLIFTIGCKVQKKNQVSNDSNALVKSRGKETRLSVSSINAKYMLVDSFAVKVFAQIEFSGINEATTLKQLNDFFKVQWSVQTEYGTKEKIKSGKIDINEEYFKRVGNTYFLTFEIAKIKNISNGILILDFVDTAMALKFTNDLPIDFTAKRVDSRFMIFEEKNLDFPSFQSFVSIDKPIVINSLKPSNEKLYLKYYINKSLPALSPMSNSKRNVLDEFSYDSLIEINAGEKFSLKKEGLYMLTQKPDEEGDSYSFLVMDDRFPRLTYPDELREALVYMSTPKEIEELKSTENAKDAIDLYFLNVSKGNQAMAKQIIKVFYKRIAEANRLFSTYKEGWKTDKGMVFVIMGPPSRVQRNRQREVWLYAQNQNNSEIIFTFYRKANLFSDQSHELVRYPEYSSFWYPYVEAWRTGNVVE